MNFNYRKKELLKEKDNILKEFKELYFDCLDFGLNLVQIINDVKHSENEKIELEKILEKDNDFQKISILYDCLKYVKNLDDDDIEKHKTYTKRNQID